MNKIKGNDEVLKDIVNVLEPLLNPAKIILFGSRASGKAQKYSDFDIAVQGSEINTRRRRLAMEALDKKLGIFSVDLINLDKTDSEFRKQVLKRGRIIYER